MNPKTKVFFNGKQVFFGNQYKKISIFQRAKFWMIRVLRTTIKILTIGGLAGGALYIAFLVGYSSMPVHLKAESKDELPAKVEELKNTLANLIHQGETDGHTMTEGEIFSVFDPSASMKAECLKANTVRKIDCESYGPYQEKIGTIMHYAVQVYGRKVSQIEAMQIANDPIRAKDFLIQCSLKVQGCVWNWTAARNEKAQVELLIGLIRTLEK